MRKCITNVNLVIIWELIGTMDTRPYTPENAAYWIWVGIARTLRPYAPTHCLGPKRAQGYKGARKYNGNITDRIAYVDPCVQIHAI